MIDKSLLQPGDIVVSRHWGKIRVSSYEEAKPLWSNLDGFSDIDDCSDNQFWGFRLGNELDYLRNDIPYKFEIETFIEHHSQSTQYDPAQQPYDDEDI